MVKIHESMSNIFLSTDGTHFRHSVNAEWSSLMAQTVKNLPGMQETQVQSLSQEDPLENRNGSSLQNSCLENPMDRGAWWATVHAVAELDTTDAT